MNKLIAYSKKKKNEQKYWQNYEIRDKIMGINAPKTL